jgi:hypothetical protein
MAKMKSFTVRRKKWARGGINGEAALLNDEGCMCCLGFAACQISRIPKTILFDEGEPNGVYKSNSFLTVLEKLEDDSTEVSNNDLANRAMAINDDTDISDKMREAKLKRLFRKHKIIINFVD